MNLILKQTLLDQLGVITEYDRANYVRLEADAEVRQISKRAAWVNGVWVPKSMMRCDFDGSLWVADWFYGKNFE